VLPEGEGESKEGEIISEDEGEPVIEGEGEMPDEGEGEVTEGEGEGEPGPCGCCNSSGKSLTPKDLFERALGDWMIFGLTLMALTALTYSIKK
jgi:hypothetical protein